MMMITLLNDDRFDNDEDYDDNDDDDDDDEDHLANSQTLGAAL